MVYNRDEAVARARASLTNVPGTCQKWTREIFGAPSAGDRDGDGDADAVDGWNSEPVSARHPGDRKPPAGVPVAFSGGSKGYGHRAVSLGKGQIRSTDMAGPYYKPGQVGTCSIEQVEKAMGIKYLGWSETITGLTIPKAPKPPKTSRGEKVDGAIRKLENAKGEGVRGKLIERALKVLNRIKPIK